MKKVMVLISASLMLVACEPPDVAKLLTPPAKEATSIKRNVDSEQLSRGAVLFKQNCADCHGDQAQGAVNWQKRDKHGKLPAPPLNGSGHTWHHPMAALKYTIKNGTGKIGGNMPAFAGRLTDAQIEDILIFVQAKWPDPIYDAWHRTDERAKK